MSIMNWLKEKLGTAHTETAYQAVLAQNQEIRQSLGELKTRLEPIADARDPFLALWALRDPKMAALAHELNEESHFHWGPNKP